MKITRRLLICFHFLIVIIAVSHLDTMINWQPVLNLMQVYSSFNSTNKGFGFFSPNVSDDYQLNLKAFKSKDTTGRVFILPGTNAETRVRYESLLWSFAQQTPDIMDLYARSWGVYCMNQDTSVNKVVVSIFRDQIPAMSAYKKGSRVTKKLYYQSTLNAR
jgi:hypothetical protein